MRAVLLVLACAALIGAVYGFGLSRALFSLYFLMWVPFVLIIGAVLVWQWRGMKRETPLSEKPTGLWRPDDVKGGGRPSDKEIVLKTPGDED